MARRPWAAVAVLALSGTAALAQAVPSTAEALAAELRAQGFTRIEITEGPTQTRVEAVRDGRTLDYVFDRRTLEVLSQEVEPATAEDLVPGLEIDREEEDFVAAPGAVLDRDDDDGRDGEDDGDDDRDGDDRDDGDDDDEGEDSSGSGGDDDGGRDADGDEDRSGPGADDGDDDDDDDDDDDGEDRSGPGGED